MNPKNDSDYKRKATVLLDVINYEDIPCFIDVYRKKAIIGGVVPTIVAAINSCDAFFIAVEEINDEDAKECRGSESIEDAR